MIVAGARVRLVSLPDWTLSGLPEEEQAALKAFVGGRADVTEVDAHGYVRIASGR
ncbi:hypothetical protein [Methylocystis parvus]|uniref:hypothetical protein n=1 Tax=Methylocystis parvus TaxID=134 RepID=UPI000306080C|nr:hypothetical protein [Methylocystis parvus]WBK00906.1 hypothetical protein MMG94_04075 [Methylocystis parvus OBBP]